MLLKFEKLVAALLFASRWILMPCYIGLLAALAIVLVEFFRELVHAVEGFAGLGSSDVILAVLKLVDLLLVGNLLLIMAFAGVEIFVPAAISARVDRPDWMGKVDFGGLKLKVVASIVAIASVQLLETFMNVAATDKTTVLWEIAILLTFVVAGVLLAWMDRLTAEH